MNQEEKFFLLNELSSEKEAHSKTIAKLEEITQNAQYYTQMIENLTTQNQILQILNAQFTKQLEQKQSFDTILAEKDALIQKLQNQLQEIQQSGNQDSSKVTVNPTPISAKSDEIPTNIAPHTPPSPVPSSIMSQRLQAETKSIQLSPSNQPHESAPVPEPKPEEHKVDAEEGSGILGKQTADDDRVDKSQGNIESTAPVSEQEQQKLPLSPVSALKKAKALISDGRQLETNEDFVGALNIYNEAIILLPENMKSMLTKKIEMLSRKTAPK